MGRGGPCLEATIDNRTPATAATRCGPARTRSGVDLKLAIEAQVTHRAHDYPKSSTDSVGEPRFFYQPIPLNSFL
jgi:hypothetical protein